MPFFLLSEGIYYDGGSKRIKKGMRDLVCRCFDLSLALVAIPGSKENLSWKLTYEE